MTITKMIMTKVSVFIIISAMSICNSSVYAASFVPAVEAVEPEAAEPEAAALPAVSPNHNQEYYTIFPPTKGDDILDAIREHGMALCFYPQYYDDDEAVFLAVHSDGMALQCASVRLKSDMKTVLAAVQNEGLSLQIAEGTPRTSSEIIHAALNQNPLSLEFATKEVQSDFRTVLKVVQKEGDALEFASEKLQGNVDVVLSAVRQSVDAFYFAKVFTAEIILAAVQHDGEILCDDIVPRKYTNDYSIVVAALTQNGDVLSCAHEKLQEDLYCQTLALTNNTFKAMRTLMIGIKSLDIPGTEPDIELQDVLKNVRDDPINLVYHPFYWSHKEVMKTALELNGGLLFLASSELRDDIELVKIAIKQRAIALQYASDSIRSNEEIVRFAVDNHPSALRYIPVSMKDDKELIMAGLKQDGMLLCNASLKMRRDPEVVLTAVEKDPRALECSLLNKDAGYFEIITATALAQSTFPATVYPENSARAAAIEFVILTQQNIHEFKCAMSKIINEPLIQMILGNMDKTMVELVHSFGYHKISVLQAVKAGHLEKLISFKKNTEYLKLLSMDGMAFGEVW